MADVRNGQMSQLLKWLLGLASVLIVASGVRLIDHEIRLSNVDDIKESVLHAENHAHAAEAMAAKHLAEMAELREDLKAVRLEITTATDVLSRQIQQSTRNRFTSTEWQAEKSWIETQFENFRLKLEQVLDQMPNSDG